MTVPTEFQYVAIGAWTKFSGLGGKILNEYTDHSLPEAATVLYKTSHKQVFAICDPRPKNDRIELWASFGRACAIETHIVFCVPDTAKIPANLIAGLKKCGVGLASISVSHDFVELVPSIDLAFNVSLPPLSRHKGNYKKSLEIIYSSFSDDWKKSFEDACKLVESRARQHLQREAKSGIAIVVEKGKQKKLTDKSVARMTLGQLAHAFCTKLSQSALDSALCGGLKRINPDRVGVAHNKLSPANLRRLKKRVCGHMWTIDSMLYQLR